MFRVIKQGKNYRHSKRVLFNKLNYDVKVFYRNKSHYTALGLDTSASPQDIKSAYYKLSLKYHPDKNQGSPESVEKFREISEAYEILSNQTKKRVYDESLSHRYSEAEWRREHYSPRSYQYHERWSKPRTGRSAYYNHDEHYKQHYEDYEKQQRVDYEYFKRRWEADYRRRYPFNGKPDWAEYERKQREYSYNFDWKATYRRRMRFYFLTMVFAFFLFVLPILDEQPPPIEKKKKPSVPFYYKTKKDNEEDDES